MTDGKELLVGLDVVVVLELIVIIILGGQFIRNQKLIVALLNAVIAAIKNNPQPPAVVGKILLGKPVDQ